jgi:hypothetical protein
MAVNKENVEKLCARLESATERQGRGAKFEGAEEFGYPSSPLDLAQGKFCALGIVDLCAVEQGVVVWSNVVWAYPYLDPQAQLFYGFEHGDPWINLPNGEQVSIVAANDDLVMSFWDIAQAIRATYLKED